MQTYKAIAKILVITGSIMMLATPVMAAGQQKRTGSGQGTMDRIRTPDKCKGIETNADSAIAPLIAARYGNGSGAGQGTMDRTRTRTQTPGKCKSVENTSNELMA